MHCVHIPLVSWERTLVAWCFFLRMGGWDRVKRERRGREEGEKRERREREREKRERRGREKS